MTYQVMAVMTLTLGVTVSAESLADALEKSKKFNAASFFKPKGDYLAEDEFRVTGVYEDA